MRIQKQAFTLVELIVVITILAILWTIAFISLQWYSEDARDSIRISDVSSMKTSLELFHLNSWKYPLPDEYGTFTYLWNDLFYQWYFWDSVIQSLSRNIAEVPLDPLTEKKYIYSVSNTKNELEILSLLEWDNIVLNIIWQTSAASTTVIPKITWNYNWLFVKTSSHIVPIPSLITSEEVTAWWTKELTESWLQSLVINKWENIPSNGNVISNTWALTWLVLTWALNNLNKDSVDADKAAVIEIIKLAYIWETSLNNEWIIEYVLNLETDDTTLAWLFDTIVLNEPVTSTNAVATFSCWDTVSAWWYTYTTILWADSNCWTSQNMNHWDMLVNWWTMPSDTDIIEKWCYNNNTSNECDTDWWLYTWSEAMWFDASCNTVNCVQAEDTSKSVCGQLWTWWWLPTDTQWTDLTNAWATWWTWDQLSWIVSSLSGYRSTNSNFYDVASGWTWWSSTETTTIGSWSLFLNSGNSTVGNGTNNKAVGISIVCVKN